MIRLISLLSLLPGAVLAHGAHPPVAEEAHGLAHAIPVLAVLVVCAVVFALVARWRS